MQEAAKSSRKMNEEGRTEEPSHGSAPPLYSQQPAWWMMKPDYCEYYPASCAKPICGSVLALKPTECKILMYLNFRAWDPGTHTCRVSKEQIAEDCDLAKRTVDKAVERLIHHDLIAAVGKKGENTGRGYLNLYRIADAPKGCKLRQERVQITTERVQITTGKGAKRDIPISLKTRFKTISANEINEIPEIGGTRAYFESIRNPATGRIEIPPGSDLVTKRMEIARVRLGNQYRWKEISKAEAWTPELFE